MNEDRVEKNKKEAGGENMRYWKNKLNKELVAFAGKYEQVAEIFQRKYDAFKEGVKQQVDEFKDIIEQFKNPVGS
jgi:hypothetical protein